MFAKFQFLELKNATDLGPTSLPLMTGSLCHGVWNTTHITGHDFIPNRLQPTDISKLQREVSHLKASAVRKVLFQGSFWDLGFLQKNY